MSEEQAVYYKVVSGGSSQIVRGRAAVRYKPMEFVTAPKWLADNGYHLFVFETEEDALVATRICSRDILQLEVYKCCVRGVTKEPPGYLSLYHLKRGSLAVINGMFPPGTVMAEEVMIFGDPIYTRR